MSYEGIEQILCKNGHYYEFDVYYNKIYEGFKTIEYDSPDEIWNCPVCKEKAGWINIIDATYNENNRIILEETNGTCKIPKDMGRLLNQGEK